MNKWIRKSFVVMVSILTFGLVTPTQLINNVNADKPAKKEVFNTSSQPVNLTQHPPFLEQDENVVDGLKQKAETLSYQKFGAKIKPVIEDEFREVILPNIEKVLDGMAGQIPKAEMRNLAISEVPGKGYSEKIFHVKNRLTNQDLLRFHVRRDNPPQAGYWFNFHYHTFEDGFQSHKELGSIYWAKNTPPKWMS